MVGSYLAGPHDRDLCYVVQLAACREAAGLEHDTAKTTGRLCGGLRHFFKNGPMEKNYYKKMYFL